MQFEIFTYECDVSASYRYTYGCLTNNYITINSTFQHAIQQFFGILKKSLL